MTRRPHAERGLLLLAFAQLAPALVVGCGGSTATNPSPGAASLSGTVAGTTFAVASETALQGAATATSACEDAGSACVTTRLGRRLAIVLSNRAALTCEAVQAEISANESPAFAGLDLLELEVTGDADEVSAGTYVIGGDTGSAPSAAGLFTTQTATCGADLDLVATSGAVTLASVGPTSASGTYDVVFGAQGSFAGSFDVALCELPDAGSGPAGAPECRP